MTLLYVLLSKIENICRHAKSVLIAMLVFVSVGTVLVIVEIGNLCQNIRQKKILHPVFLSIFVYVVEELPLAFLSWYFKTFANDKMADGWEFAMGTTSIVGPLLIPILKACTNNQNTYCDGWFSKKRETYGVYFLFPLAFSVFTISVLKWKDIKAPGAELCA